jgi:peroxiredoxin
MMKNATKAGAFEFRQARHNLFLCVSVIASLIGLTSAAPGDVGTMAYEWSAFNLKDLTGKTQNLKDYQGKAVLIFTVQYNCGGCVANAPRVGTIAMKFQGQAFQALGVDVAKGTLENDQFFSTKYLKAKDTSLNFPILRGLPDSQLVSAQDGLKWKAYNSYRDVFIVVDHMGKIVHRLDGDRRAATSEANYTALETAIRTAISNVPTSTIGAIGDNGLCVRACKRAGLFQIDLDSRSLQTVGTINLRILDPKGRLIRELATRSNASSGNPVVWDGLDAGGRVVSWGSYFLNVTAAGSSTTLLLPWLP